MLERGESHVCSRQVFTLTDDQRETLQRVPLRVLVQETGLDRSTVMRSLSSLPHAERTHAILMKVFARHRVQDTSVSARSA